jgi:AraC-like DNA-binding protein
VGVLESVASSTDGGHRLRIRLESDVLTRNRRVVEVDTGSYNALRYAYVSAAINAMHDDPAHGWTLQELRRRAGMSRSTFA